MEILLAVAGVLASHFPLFIVFIVGIVLAVTRWRKHPGLSLLVLITFILLIIHSIATSTFSVLLPILQREYEMSITTLSTIFGLVTLIPNVILWSLVVWAIFGWRVDRRFSDG